MNNKIEDIYIKYKDLVFYYFNIKLNDRAVSEELTQEVFLKVYKSLHKYRGEASVKNWVLSIAKNEMANYFRKNSKVIVDELKDEHVVINQNRLENPQEYIEDKENLKLAFQIMDKLTQEQREVLILFDIKQLSYKDIQKRLNWSLPKVKVTLYRARIKYRQLYRMVNNNEM